MTTSVDVLHHLGYFKILKLLGYKVSAKDKGLGFRCEGLGSNM